MSSVPDVISISYGEPEADIGPATLQRLQIEFKKLAARRKTVISTSGDVGSSDGGSCTPKLSADFPSSSIYTVSLGATQLVQQRGQPVDSAACSVAAGSGFTTGGMFSDIFSRPEWQDRAVKEYLEQTSAYPADKSLFNNTGRAYNDVATLGSNIPVIIGGDIHITGGTSASGPIFAGLMGLLNDELQAHGKPTVGWITPWLYGKAATGCFRAVATGFNGCTEPGTAGPNGNSTCCQGFSTSILAAWNPLGGLGAPLWDAMREQLMKAD